MRTFNAFVSVALAMSCVPVFAAADIRGVVGTIEGRLSPKDFTARYDFKNFRTDGTTSEYQTRIQSRSVVLQHISFEGPEREKGREVLRDGDSLWTFVPSVGRVIKIEDRESFAGGDFSNADILRVDWLAQYAPSLSKETDKQCIIYLTAKGPKAAYAKMRLWVKKENGQPVQQEFYDSNSTLLKRLRYGSVKEFKGVIRPSFLIMENVITGQKSELRIVSIETGQKLPESRFVMDNLGK
jgi:outer membrane lipoprotein-sorting protein